MIVGGPKVWVRAAASVLLGAYLGFGLTVFAQNMPPPLQIWQRKHGSTYVAPAAVALDGHSILAGVTSGAKPPVIVQTYTGRSTPTTYAIGGSTDVQCVSRNAAIIANGTFGFYDFQCAVNNILADEPAFPTIWQVVQPGLNQMVASGMVVIANDELPCAGPCTDAGSEELLNYNALLHGWCAARAATATCLKDYSDFSDVTDPTYMNTALCAPDGIHMNDAGSILLGYGIANKVNDAGLGNPAANLIDFATGTGSSLGTACANVDIFTVDGGVVTTTRAGTAYCNKKGYANTGLASGDIVLVSANRPRVMPGWDGGMGVLREKAGSNATTFPTALTGADWASQAIGTSVAPVVTAGQIDPLGGTAGVRLDLDAAATAADGSLRYNLNGVLQGAGTSQCLFVRGVSGVSDTGTIDLVAFDTTANHAANCAFVSGSWSRCLNENFDQSDVATGYAILGNAPFYNPAHTARPAQSVIVWGASGEQSVYCTSFMNGTRGGETMTTPITTTNADQISISGIIDWKSGITLGASLFQVYKDANNFSLGFATSTSLVGSTNSCNMRSGSADHSLVSTAQTTITGFGGRTACWNYQAVGGACANNTTPDCIMGYQAATLTTGVQEFNIGGRHAAGFEPNAIVRNVIVSDTAGGAAR